MMGTAEKTLSHDRTERISPRERILAAASDLFYRHGIRAIGVDAIAEAAETNKMTLYRHFSSKDELVAEYLRRAAETLKASWQRLELEHPDPRARLHAWLEGVSSRIARGDDRGCPLANAAVELSAKDHPARRVIEDLKRAQREHLVRLCAAGRLDEPDMLAEELFLLIEGARLTAQCMGREGLADRLMRMGEAMIKAHTVASPQSSAG